MNWSSHVKAFQAQWILRYAADPATSSWKNLLDSLLLEDGEGRIKFTEGRSIFFCPLKFNHRLKLLADLPKKAHYIRACIKSFWSLNITQDLNHPRSIEHVGAESPWLNPRLSDAHATHANRRYYGSVISLIMLSDIMDKQTNQPFDFKQWKYWINKLDAENLERQHLGAATRASGLKLLHRWAVKLHSFLNKRIPQHIIAATLSIKDYQ